MHIPSAHMCARNNVVICIYAFATCIPHLAVALLNIAIGTSILSVHKCAKHNVIICIGAWLQLWCRDEQMHMCTEIQMKIDIFHFINSCAKRVPAHGCGTSCWDQVGITTVLQLNAHMHCLNNTSGKPHKFFETACTDMCKMQKCRCWQNDVNKLGESPFGSKSLPLQQVIWYIGCR